MSTATQGNELPVLQQPQAAKMHADGVPGEDMCFRVPGPVLMDGQAAADATGCKNAWS